MLNKVTITGADDKTNIGWMLETSKRFPFVEWGILVSRRQEGTARFPSRDWIYQLLDTPGSADLQLSTHLCGAWVRQLLKGELDWAEVPSIAMRCQRIQINTHAEEHVTRPEMIKNMSGRNVEYIFQWDGVNDHHAYTTKCFGIRTAVLFDMSGGAGILPERWPPRNNQFLCGYAGGLGPDNVVEEVRKIEKCVPVGSFWIDMERRVRSEDDTLLVESKVESVLEQTKQFMPSVVLA